MSKIQRKPILQSRINQKEFGDVGGISVEKKITELVDFNPTRLVKKGKLAPFVDMAALPTNGKCISEIGEREFTGSGSKFKNGDTLFARITPCLENGKTAKVFGLPEGVAGCGSTEFIVMAAKEPEFDEEYVYYFARLPEFRAFAQARMEGTSGRQRVSWQALTDFSFNFPDKKIRKKVGNILKELDDKIELNRQINQTLEQMAQAIFKSWFVDFDPVRAKMEGRDTGLPAHIADLFPVELEESELGLKPTGWHVGSIGDIAKAKGGYAYKGEAFIKIGYRVVKIKNIVGDGTVDISDCDCIDDELASNTKRFKLGDGDLLIAMTGATVGKVGLIITSGDNVFLNQRVAKFESDIFGKKISWFLFCTFKQKSVFDLIVGSAQGSAQPNISSTQIESTKIIVPHSDCISKYCEIVDPLFENWMANLNENMNLSVVRDSLLPKLLSGKIEVEKD